MSFVPLITMKYPHKLSKFHRTFFPYCVMHIILASLNCLVFCFKKVVKCQCINTSFSLNSSVFVSKFYHDFNIPVN